MYLLKKAKIVTELFHNFSLFKQLDFSKESTLLQRIKVGYKT